MTEQKLWTRSFAIITLENFQTALNFWLLMAVVSRFATDRFGASTSLAGFSASIFIVGALIARPLCGKWIHRVGQTRTLVAGVVVSLALTVSYLAVNSSGLLLLVRFLHGASWGATHVAVGTIVASVVPRERYGEGLGYFSLSQIIATAIGPFIGLPLIQKGDFNAVVFICCAVSVVGLGLLPFLAVKNLQLTAEQVRETRGFKLESYIQRTTVPIALMGMLIYLCYASIISFLALYSAEIGLTRAATFFFLACAAVMFVTRPFIGRLFDARGENWVFYPAIPVFAVSLTVLSQARSGWMLLLAGAILGLGFGAIQSTAQATAIKITPPHRSGLATSTFYAFADFGAGVGPLVCGFIIPFIGYRGTFLVVAAIGAACLLLYHTLYGRRVRRVTMGSMRET